MTTSARSELDEIARALAHAAHHIEVGTHTVLGALTLGAQKARWVTTGLDADDDPGVSYLLARTVTAANCAVPGLRAQMCEKPTGEERAEIVRSFNASSYRLTLKSRHLDTDN